MNYLFLLLLLSGWGSGCNSCNNGCNTCNNGCNCNSNGTGFLGGCGNSNVYGSRRSGCGDDDDANLNSGFMNEEDSCPCNRNAERNFPSFAQSSCGCEMENS